MGEKIKVKSETTKYTKYTKKGKGECMKHDKVFFVAKQLMPITINNNINRRP